MKRKIVQNGPLTLGVSLPSGWVKRYGLRKGDELDVEEIDQGLLLSTSVRGKKTVALTLTKENKSFVTMMLNALYRQGYDVITITANDQESIRNVKEAVRHLLGFELSRRGNDLVVENIAEPSGNLSETLLRKIFLLISQMFETTLAGFQRHEPALRAQIEEDSEKITQYESFCRRSLNRSSIRHNSVSSYLLLYSRLQLIGRSFHHLHEYLPQKKTRIGPEALRALEQAQAAFAAFSAGFYHKDFKKLSSINDILESELYQRIYPALMRSRGADNLVLYHTGELLRLIFLCESAAVGILVDETR
jgi:phosphate uptake regulator